jgi:RHS repeat-associated protein
MMIKERSWSSSSYRFGFQGQEGDDEVSGEGNSYTAEYWQYNSRLLRRWNTDPIVKPFESPYACFRNNPILLIDPTGEDVDLDKLLSKKDKAEIKNKVNPEHEDYNEAYASLYQKLVDDKNTMYTFNNTHKRIGYDGGEMGNVSYDGKKNEAGQDIININYTTDLYNSMSPESALFEETFHADQFRRGEFGFTKEGDSWGTFGADIYDEVDAKIWAHSNVNNGNPLGQNRTEYVKYSKKGKDREAYARYLQSSDIYRPVYGDLHNESENVVENIMRANKNKYSKDQIRKQWFDQVTGLLSSPNRVGRLPHSE